MGLRCGWSHDFIADNLTIDQIFLYYKLIQKQLMLDLKFDAITASQAMAYGFGSIKKTEFDKFLESLDPDMVKQNQEHAFEKMKYMGLPVEEN